MTVQVNFSYMSYDILEVIIGRIKNTIDHPDLTKELAKQWPHYRFIQCTEDDMDMRPEYQVLDQFLVYLIAGSYGCATFTDNPEQAIGLVIANREFD